MTTAYTSLLGLALPVTGELSGTWGDTVNDYITQYLDASVAGTQTISGSQTAVTLSKTTNASLSQAGSGATGSSQYNVINCTGNPASMLTVTVPAASKTYVVVNATSTNQDVKIVGAGPTTGVTLVAGERAIIAWNGSDFIKVATSTADGVTTLSFGSTGLTPSTATSGAVTVAGTLVAANGGTGQSSYTTGDLLYATGSTALSKLGIGTNGQILTSTGTAPQWSTLSGVAVTTFSAGTTGFTPSSATSGAVTLAGTLATTNGGTGLTSFTANRVFYASSTSAIGQSANLTFDGTTLTANALTTTSTVTINGGTANGVAYLDGSKVLTTGSGFTFNGAALGLPSASVSVGLNTSGQFIDVINGDSTNAQRLRLTTSGTDGVIQVTRSAGTVPNLIFRQDASELMRLTTTGLGIGTSSPSVKLDVQGGSINTSSFVTITPTTTTLNAIYRATNTGGTFYAGLDNSAGGVTGTAYAAMIWHTGAYPISFGTNNTLRATLDSSGNLGIGTSSPTNILSLGGNSARTIWMERHTTANTAGNNLTLQSGGATSGATDKNGGTLILSSGTATGSGSSLITFLTAVAGAAGTADRAPAERGRFDASGNFLVGTTTNTNTSSIVANGTISETVSSTQYLVASQFDIGTAPNEIPLNQYLGNLAYQNASSIAGQVGLSAGTAALPSLVSATDTDTGLWFPAANQIAASVGGIEGIRLTSTGLGIGTSSPADKLSVVGAARLTADAASVSLYTGAGWRHTGTGPLYIDANFGGAANSFFIRNGSSLTTQLTLDASGNLGLGVTPSAWATVNAYQVGRASIYGYAGVDSGFQHNAYFNAGWKYAANDFATQYQQVSGIHRWFTAASGTAGNAISFTQAMTLDASGNLLVGNTTQYGTANRAAVFSANKFGLSIIDTTAQTTGVGGALNLGGNYRSAGDAQAFVRIEAAKENATDTNYAYAMAFSTTPNGGTFTERARITSVGNLSLGGTADRGTTVGTNAIQIFNGTAPAGTLTNGVSLYSSSGDLNFMNSSGNGFKVGYRNLPAVGTQTGSYTLAAADAGKYVQVGSGGSITVPTSVFAEGDAITLYNNTTGNITITCSAVTAYTAGTNTVKTSMTLATRGVATILFYSATACVISGNVS